MKFLDSNIVLYAYLKPKKNLKLTEKIRWRKKRSQEILRRLEEGLESVIISTVHLGEILNILSKKVNNEAAILFLGKILSLKGVEIISVSKRDYQKALLLCLEYNIEPNDALAIVIMNRYECNEIYTFDSDFREIPDIEKPLLNEEYSKFG